MVYLSPTLLTPICAFVGVLLLTADETSRLQLRRQGEYWLQRGDTHKAEEAFTAALEGARPFGVDDPHYAQALTEVAIVKQQLGDYGSAEANLRQALSIVRKASAQGSLLTATILVTLGDLLRVKGPVSRCGKANPRGACHDPENGRT